MATPHVLQLNEVQTLILQRLESIDAKLTTMTDDLHSGARRMDGLERDLRDLNERVQRNADMLDAQGGKIAELEPVIEMTRNLKRFLYAAAAVVIALQFLPQVLQQIKAIK